jgi:AcrR family transcriptional regulator
VTEELGLRERKKLRTRASLREHALRLIREQGYHATTVEQIAAAAEVSPSTFFRYFPTKEDVVLQDDLDLRLVEMLERQPAELGVISAIRSAIRDAMYSYTEADLAMMRETTALMVQVPEIRARAVDELMRTVEIFALAIGNRAGKPADDLAVRTVAGAIVGVIMAVTMPHWGRQDADEWFPGSFGLIDEALALIEKGMPL